MKKKGKNVIKTDDDDDCCCDGYGWILLGCDSDAGGALALVRGPSVGVIAAVDVLDAPTMKVEVNGKPRTRLCVEEMVGLVTRLKVPPGTTVHLEEGGVEYGFSAQTAFVQGYNFGLWKGVLAAAGLEVSVVKPQAWKWAFGLAHKGSTKDESRAMASAIFPEVVKAGLLKRKKDHGRAEALLIAAYGHMAAHARRGYYGNGNGNGKDGKDGVDGVLDAGDPDPLCTRIREMVTTAATAAAGTAGGDGDGEEVSSSAAAKATATAVGLRVGPDDPLPYFGPYFGMTGKQLGAECKSRGLKVSGKKMELVTRLEEDDIRQLRVGAGERGDREEEEEEEEEHIS